MTAKRLFLRWSLIGSLTVVGFSIITSLGWINMMVDYDVTKLSVVILSVFAVATLWCGWLAWRVDRGTPLDSGTPFARMKFIKSIENEAEHGWFAAGLCEKLGLTGTVFGFVIMLIGGFHGFDSSDPASMQQLLEQLSTGMSTAFITTLVGVVCSIILSVQYHLLARKLESMQITRTILSAPPPAAREHEEP
ncbi:MotA/TolQ/ExbB proton channel family protein [Patescibacteria group bacterium]